MLSGLSGCAKVPKEGAKDMGEKETAVHIGITFDTFVLERWTRDRDVFVSTAQKLGAKVDVQNANGDVSKQRSQINKFIEEQMDVIVVVAVDCFRVTDLVKKARSQGIQVISYDRMVQGTVTDLYITVDNEQVGAAMAKTIKERLPNGGNVVMICGPEADTNTLDVVNGFEKELNGSNLTIVEKGFVKAWTPEYGFQAVNDAFKSVEKIDAVMCGNDGLAGYAIKALSEQQLAGTIVVTGQDADLEACQRVIEGTQAMTVYKPIEELAKQAASYAVQLANQGKLSDITDMKSNDVGEVPYCGLEPIAVTKDNMDEVIVRSGFHLQDEVYLNMN